MEEKHGLFREYTDQYNTIQYNTMDTFPLFDPFNWQQQICFMKILNIIFIYSMLISVIFHSLPAQNLLLSDWLILPLFAKLIWY